MTVTDAWIALAIGNSRLHWAWMQGTTVALTWDTPHLSPVAIARLLASSFDFTQLQNQRSDGPALPDLHSCPPLWLASVVPAQAALWQSYDRVHSISLTHIPLQNLYPTLGIDRALTLLAASATWGNPILVVDAGTALTFTATQATGEFMGGAILPGVQLQLRSLGQHTAALPNVSLDPFLPDRWATTTPAAILSGVIHTVLAGIRDFGMAWLQGCPDGAIALTGGDSHWLAPLLQPDLPRLHLAPHLIFEGMQLVRATQFAARS